MLFEFVKLPARFYNTVRLSVFAGNQVDNYFWIHGYLLGFKSNGTCVTKMKVNSVKFLQNTRK